MKKHIILSVLAGIGVVIIAVFILYFTGNISFSNTAIVNPSQQFPTVKSLSTKDFINMTDSVFFKIKEQEIMSMIKDSAKAHGLKPEVICGLSWHESAKFQYAHKKILDRNKKYSYGLFMIQLDVALSIDPKATEEKLLTPVYNTWIAMQLFDKNLIKYGNRYPYAIAAHNAGVIYHDKITNPDFVKLVYTSIGEIIAKNDF